MESPDVSHDQQMAVVAVEIKVEEETSEDDDFEHKDAESYFWVKKEPSLTTREKESEVPKMLKAQDVQQKLELRGMPDKCAVCHKALQGSSSVDGAEQNSILRCNRCREDEVTGNQKHATLTKADISLDMSCHPTHFASRTCQVKSEISEIVDHPTCGNTTVAGRSIPFSYLGESTEVLAHREGTCSSTIHSGVQAVEQLSGCRNCLQTFSLDRDPVRQQPDPEDKACRCSSRIHPGVQTVEKRVGWRNPPRNSYQKHDRVRKQAPQEGVTGTSSRDPGVQKVEKQNRRQSISQIHDLVRKQVSKDGLTHVCSSRKPGVQAQKVPFSSRNQLQSSSKNHYLMRQRAHQEGLTCTYSSTIVSRDHELGSMHAPQKRVTNTFISRNPGVQIAEKPGGSRNHLQSSSQKHELVRCSRAQTDGRPPFRCNMCNHSFISRSNFKFHVNEQSCEGLFGGSICPKRSSQADYLESTSINEKPFSCSRCTKTFATESYLIQHMKMHHKGERYLACRFCGKSFACNVDLIRHIRTHTGERPFRCNICKKGYSRKSHLMNHMKKHSGKAY